MDTQLSNYLDFSNFNTIIASQYEKALIKCNNLISTLEKNYADSGWDDSKKLQIITSESLTAGLIMSTLTDIPHGGAHKYGCFGVYDTDAKRVFNNVNVKDVYTGACAKEMAIGALKNSNASLAIAVTGNSMPYNPDYKRLGEVFIAIAGYYRMPDNKLAIKCQVSVVNMTNKLYIANPKGNNTVKLIEWYNFYNSLPEDKLTSNFNPYTLTGLVSRIIRLKTVEVATELCNDFVNKYKKKLIVPTIIMQRKTYNETKYLTNPNGKVKPVNGIKVKMNEIYEDISEKHSFSSKNITIGNQHVALHNNNQRVITELVSKNISPKKITKKKTYKNPTTLTSTISQYISPSTSPRTNASHSYLPMKKKTKTLPKHYSRK